MGLNRRVMNEDLWIGAGMTGDWIRIWIKASGKRLLDEGTNGL